MSLDQEKTKEFQMRERNWKEYNKQLVQRGSLTFLLDPKIFRSTKKNHATRKSGRPQEFSDSIIELLLRVKIHFRLSYRTLQGFAQSFLTSHMPNKKAPNYSLVCKRVQSLGNSLPKLASTQSKIMIIDSSGMKICGEGEWKVKIHGRGRPRKWMKVHIGINPETQEIIAEATTVATVGDSSVVKNLMDQVKAPKQVLADGAYDRKAARDEIKSRGSNPIIPPPKNAKYKSINDERDRAILEILGLGGDKTARSLWGKLTGYNLRVLVETVFSSLKRLFGDRFFSKTVENQQVESRVRCLLLNRMRTMRV